LKRRKEWWPKLLRKAAVPEGKKKAGTILTPADDKTKHNLPAWRRATDCE